MTTTPPTTILPRQQPLTVGEAIKIAGDYLSSVVVGFGQGTVTPVDDAAWIVLESAGLSPIEPPDYGRHLAIEAIEKCDHWLYRRATERIPVAYLVGRIWFAGLEFEVDERALIPRSPIAELILGEFDGLVDTTQPFAVLDLCTGGGCIALATANYLSNAMVVGTDLSTEALALAASNCERLKLTHRVSFQHSDLFASINQTFDLIVSNPPYVDASDIAAMDAEFHHEPAIALASGVDGLDITRQILEQARDYLTPAGVLIVEVGNSAAALEAEFPDLPFLWFEFASGGGGVFALTRDELA